MDRVEAHEGVHRGIHGGHGMGQKVPSEDSAIAVPVRVATGETVCSNRRDAYPFDKGHLVGGFHDRRAQRVPTGPR